MSTMVSSLELIRRVPLFSMLTREGNTMIREMVSRVMKDLEACGFIETRTDGSMWVKDRLNTQG